MSPLAAAVALAAALASPAAASDDQLSFGVSMARRGLWNEALFRFRQAAKAEPANARVLNNMAVAYEAVGLFDKALETYQQALKLDGANRELRRNYARFIEFYQAFKPDEAAEPPADERPPEAAAESSPGDGGAA